MASVVVRPGPTGATRGQSHRIVHMERSLEQLDCRRFDLVVVGAGIYGSAIAWDAASRGLSVAIVDRGDFGGATSANSLKTVHGGLRSLQRAAFRDMREFIRERNILGRIAPHLIQPVSFIVPTYRHPLRNKPLMRAVMAVNDAIAWDRNAGLDPTRRLPAGRVVTRDECLRLMPGIDPAGVTGGAVWHDCQMYNSDRLTLAFVSSACRAGAVAANYAEATRLVLDGRRVDGVEVRDRLSGDIVRVRAAWVVNAAGPWGWTLLGSWLPHAGALASPPVFSKALNLVFDMSPAPHALGSLVDSRFLFLVPWRGVTMAGTSHETWAGRPDDSAPTWRDVRTFQAEVARAFPRAGVDTAEVRLVHHGLLPARLDRGGEARLLKGSLVIDHGRDGVDGLMSALGVRYTTARATAEQVVDALATRLGRPALPCRTRTTPLTGGDTGSISAFEARCRQVLPRRLDDAAIARLGRSYGTDVGTLAQLMDADAALGSPLSPSCPVTKAEVMFAVRREMAVRLGDVLRRRTDAGSAGHPGADAVAAAAAVMAGELGWTASRVDEEIAAFDRSYQLED